jgi:TolB-like protein/class 3 adenylate cyclase
MAETRKLAAILCSDVVGYSRLVGADEDRTLARLRALRSDLFDPTIAVHHGRVVKRTGDGALVEFRSVIEAVRCAIEIQNGMTERNAGLPPNHRIEFRIGVHLGDVVEETDGDLMGDGVNIAARLEGIAEPGGVCLSEDAYRQVREKLKHEFLHLGEKALKNIARPIGVYALKSSSESAMAATSASAPNTTGPPHLSIVVLPFANMSGDPEQEYFVDGVTESLTTDLSRIDGAFVIGRNTAFTYKNKPVDLRQIGRELNVRYVLEGSVQRSSARMRVSVQLIDAERGQHLWAERFDKPLADLFDMQDEIVARLANALTAQLVVAEARQAERKPSPGSMDLFLRGLAWLNRSLAADDFAEARRLFERALTLDPANVWGLIGIAYADLLVAVNFLADDRAARLSTAETALIKALSLYPESARAHLLLGAVQIHTNRASQGVRLCERALELDRNLAGAHAQIGSGKLYLNQAEDTEAHIQEALRLSPRDTRAHLWCLFAALAKFQLCKEEEAVAWLRRSIETNRNFSSPHFALAAVLARLGRLDEARSEVKVGLAMNPAFTIARLRIGASSVNADVVAREERFIEGEQLARNTADSPSGRRRLRYACWVWRSNTPRLNRTLMRTPARQYTAANITASEVASPGESSSTIRPCLETRMRSARPRISGRYEDMTTTARPLSASEPIN